MVPRVRQDHIEKARGGHRREKVFSENNYSYCKYN